MYGIRYPDTATNTSSHRGQASVWLLKGNLYHFCARKLILLARQVGYQRVGRDSTRNTFGLHYVSFRLLDHIELRLASRLYWLSLYVSTKQNPVFIGQDRPVASGQQLSSLSKAGTFPPHTNSSAAQSTVQPVSMPPLRRQPDQIATKDLHITSQLLKQAFSPFQDGDHYSHLRDNEASQRRLSRLFCTPRTPSPMLRNIYPRLSTKNRNTVGSPEPRGCRLICRLPRRFPPIEENRQALHK